MNNGGMMRKFVHGAASVLLALVIALTYTSPALAADAEDLCTTSGGTWKGPDSQNGRCTFAPGDPTAVSSCGSDLKEYWLTYESNVEVSAKCRFPNQRRTSTDGPSPKEFTLRLSNGKARVTFAPGTCTRNCSISANLPSVPKSAILLTPLATLNVRSASKGLYRVCFSNVNGLRVRIYRFLNSVWVPISPVSSAGLVCARTSGDGSFYLH
jgi:hypothetical protein